MSWTTQDLREVMTDRSLNPPVAMDRAAAAERQARHQRSARLAIGVALTACAVVASGLFGARLWDWNTTKQRIQPAGPPGSLCSWSTPCQATTTMAEVKVTTSGPGYFPLRADLGTIRNYFVVRVSMTNLSSHDNEVAIGVGIVGTPADQWSLAGGGQRFLHPWQQVEGTAPDAFTLVLDDGQRVEGVAWPKLIALAPGATRTVAIRITRRTFSQPEGPLRGWIPVLFPHDPAHATVADPSLFHIIG